MIFTSLTTETNIVRKKIGLNTSVSDRILFQTSKEMKMQQRLASQPALASNDILCYPHNGSFPFTFY